MTGGVGLSADASYVEGLPRLIVAPAVGTSSPDPEQFARFYRSTFSEVYAYLFHRCGGKQSVAEDLTQETYLAAVAAFRSGSTTDLSIPWLIGIARHKLIDYFRKVEREERKLTLAASNDSIQALVLESGAVSRERALAALAGVPPAQRAALVLRYLDDLPVTEVANLLGKGIHATESLLARGRHSLKRSYVEASDD